MSELPPSPPPHRENALAIVKRLREAGHVAYFAGGCVRDLLLGLQPKDYDVATDASPEQVRKLFRNTQAVGAAFGVMLVRLGGSQIEVATFRADLDYQDGRHPSGVRFTSAEEDARRRDFTINGLFLDPIENRVIDYVGGQEDLKAKVLRAIGKPEERFHEDHLRMLRAVRFASRFSLTVESATASAIEHHAPHLARISPERVGEEMRLMLVPPSRVIARGLLWQFRLIQVLFRTLLERPERRDIDLMSGFATAQSISFPLALAALVLEYRCHPPIPFKDLLVRSEILQSVTACRKTLRISNDESTHLSAVLSIGHLLGEPPTLAQIKRFLAGPYSSDARRLLEALRRAGLGRGPVERLEARFAELGAEDVSPIPFVTGDDLVAAGLKPGKLFKRILDDVYDAQLEGRVAMKDQAMALALQIAKSSA